MPSDAPTGKARRLTRQQLQQQTRARLLEAAARVFAKVGYENASVEAVAAAAGFTQGAVYSNFKGKADLFLQTFEAFVRPRIEALIEAVRAAPDPPSQVEALVRVFIERPEKDPFWILLESEFWLFAVRNRDHEARVRMMYAHMRRALAALGRAHWNARAQALGVSPAELASTVIGLLEGMSRQQIADPAQIDARMIRAALHALLIGPIPLAARAG